MRNLVIGERKPSSVTSIQAMPLAPFSTANLPRSSISRRAKEPAVLAFSPLTTPPDFIALEKTLNSTSLTISVKSTISSPNLKSGLSLPYLVSASSYDRRGKGVVISVPLPLRNIFFIISSTNVKMSSSSMKDISISS